MTENGAGKWVVSCASLPFTNVMASGSYGDCIKLWDVNPSNRDKDGEYLKCVNSIPVVGGEIGASVVEWVRELDLVRPVGSFHGGGVGQEHRLGRWWRLKGAKNGIFIQNLNLDLSV